MFENPQATEDGFYRAFELGDIDSMMSLWLDDGDVVCIHPLGVQLTDLDAIRSSWLEIFAAPFERKIEIEVLSIARSDKLVVRTVSEKFILPGQTRKTAPVFATNIYQKNARGWLMSCHHASPGREHAPELVEKKSAQIIELKGRTPTRH